MSQVDPKIINYVCGYMLLGFEGMSLEMQYKFKLNTVNFIAKSWQYDYLLVNEAVQEWMNRRMKLYNLLLGG